MKCISLTLRGAENLFSKQVVNVHNRNASQNSHDTFTGIFTSRSCRDSKEEQTIGVLDVLTLAPGMLSSFGATARNVIPSLWTTDLL